MNTKKNKVWTAVWLCLIIGIQLLLLGCIHSKEMIGGPYLPNKGLPEIVVNYWSSPGHNIGDMEFIGSEKKALKAAARLGARYVYLTPDGIEFEKGIYEYYTDGDAVRQRKVGTETVIKSGYHVMMWR
ncbi:MAG: hypothetical protein U9O95_08605 [Candidatus Marinimicrobia bacterium]|nr:hypothetical protein [Candidatus Neomarinimicrobiota bacterium]